MTPSSLLSTSTHASSAASSFSAHGRDSGSSTRRGKTAGAASSSRRRCNNVNGNRNRNRVGPTFVVFCGGFSFSRHENHRDRARRARRLSSTSIAASSSSDGNGDGTARFNEILTTLQATPKEELSAAVEVVREELTTRFYEFAAARVDSLAAAGDEDASAELDELCGKYLRKEAGEVSQSHFNARSGTPRDPVPGKNSTLLLTLCSFFTPSPFHSREGVDRT